MALTDSSGTYSSVVLAIKEIRVVPTDDAGMATGPGLPLITTFSPAKSVDVLSLSYEQELLGQAAVPTGSYEQVRLVLEPNPATGDPVNYATLASDPNTKLALTTPSGQESGLKIVGSFDVQPGTINAIALDFNPDKAIVSAGNSGKLLLKPTGIRIMQMSDVLSSYGTLSGTVMPDSVWPNAVVSIIPSGGGAAIAMGSVNPDDGTFRAFVPAGSGYTIKVTADGYNPYDSGALSPAVTYDVTAGQDTPVGTITLNNNGTLTGTVMPDGAWTSAVVSAFASGGTTAVASAPVKSADGTFSLSVPPATGYTIQVSATGYNPYDSAKLATPLSWAVTPLTATPVGTITLNNDGTLTGTVMPDGAWASGALVSVFAPGGTTAVASAPVSSTDGTFSIAVPPATGYTIQVTEATGYDDYDSATLATPLSWDVTAATATPVGTITLNATTPSP